MILPGTIRRDGSRGCPLPVEEDARRLLALEEGDQVTVTYTGDLTEVDPAPVAVDIQKD